MVKITIRCGPIYSIQYLRVYSAGMFSRQQVLKVKTFSKKELCTTRHCSKDRDANRTHNNNFTSSWESHRAVLIQQFGFGLFGHPANNTRVDVDQRHFKDHMSRLSRTVLSL